MQQSSVCIADVAQCSFYFWKEECSAQKTGCVVAGSEMQHAVHTGQELTRTCSKRIINDTVKENGRGSLTEYP